MERVWEVRVRAEDGDHPLASNLTKDEAMAKAVEWLGRDFNEWEKARLSAVCNYGSVVYIDLVNGVPA